jgi:hypothetical protein
MEMDSDSGVPFFGLQLSVDADAPAVRSGSRLSDITKNVTARQPAQTVWSAGEPQTDPD